MSGSSYQKRNRFSLVLAGAGDGAKAAVGGARPPAKRAKLGAGLFIASHGAQSEQQPAPAHRWVRAPPAAGGQPAQGTRTDGQQAPMAAAAAAAVSGTQQPGPGAAQPAAAVAAPAPATRGRRGHGSLQLIARPAQVGMGGGVNSGLAGRGCGLSILDTA